jgi:hypothetical protein
MSKPYKAPLICDQRWHMRGFRWLHRAKGGAGLIEMG